MTSKFFSTFEVDIKKSIPALLLVVLGAFVMQQAPFATTVTGSIEAVRFNSGVTPARVSILMRNDTACGNDGWYAYESADVGLGEVTTEGILVAYAQDKPITVVGTDTCDEFDVEQVEYVELLRSVPLGRRGRVPVGQPEPPSRARRAVE